MPITEHSYNVTIILKNPVMTALAQAGDVFESDKFVGQLVKCKVAYKGDVNNLPHNVLSKATSVNGQQVVGVIVHGLSGEVLPGHRVISDGKNWVPLERIADRLGATLKELECV